MRKAGPRVKGRFCSYDDRRDCLPEPIGKSFPEHLYNSQKSLRDMDKGTWTEVPWLHGGACQEITLRYCEHVSPWLQLGAVYFLDMLDRCEIVFRLQFEAENDDFRVSI